MAGTAGYSLSGLRPAIEQVGAVTAALPLGTEMARLPVSAFLPTVDLPLAGAVIQVVVVFGLGELLLGRVTMMVVALSAHVLSTLVARLLIVEGALWLLGLPASQAFISDTGPSAMTTAVGAALLLRCRAYWCLSILGTCLLVAAALQNNIDGREHMAAFCCGLLACVIAAAARDRGARVRTLLTARFESGPSSRAGQHRLPQ